MKPITRRTLIAAAAGFVARKIPLPKTTWLRKPHYQADPQPGGTVKPRKK